MREAGEMLETATGAAPFELFGVTGAGLYVCNDRLLATRRTSSDRPVYFVVNLSTALLLFVSLLQAFNLGAALVQLFVLAMSLIGLVRRLLPIRWSHPALDPRQV